MLTLLGMQQTTAVGEPTILNLDLLQRRWDLLDFEDMLIERRNGLVTISSTSGGRGNLQIFEIVKRNFCSNGRSCQILIMYMLHVYLIIKNS